MAMHLWLGRAFGVLALVLLGLSGTARADDSPTDPAARHGQTPAAAPRPAEPAPRDARDARDAKELFENGAATKARNDANVYITPQNIPKNDRLLKAYSVDEAAKANGTPLPGLLAIAAQTYRSQGGPSPDKKGYSLADAMRDAVWRKKTAAKLKTLTSSRPPGCVGNSAVSEPSSSLARGLAGNC